MRADKDPDIPDKIPKTKRAGLLAVPKDRAITTDKKGRNCDG